MPDAPAGVVVIGCGNPLMTDDGLGLAALERLHAGWELPPTVTLLDGGTWGMNLLPTIEDAEGLILLDAIAAGGEAGASIVLERADLPKYLVTKVSPHQIDLRDVLALAELRGTLPRHACAIGLQPAVVELGTAISPELESRLDALVRLVVDRLGAWGHACRPRVASVAVEAVDA